MTDQPAWKRSEGRDHIIPVHHPWSFKSVRRFVKKAIWLLPDMDSTGNWYGIHCLPLGLRAACVHQLSNTTHISHLISGINLGKYIWKRMLSFHMSQMSIFVIISACQKLDLKEARCCSFEGD